MGRRLVKRPKLTLAMYNAKIDEYVAQGLSEDEAMEKANNELLNGMFELDMNDEINQAIVTGGIPLMMLKSKLEDSEND